MCVEAQVQLVLAQENGVGRKIVLRTIFLFEEMSLFS